MRKQDAASMTAPKSLNPALTGFSAAWMHFQAALDTKEEPSSALSLVQLVTNTVFRH